MKVNGIRVEDVEPSRRLLDVLRDDLGLTGSKEGCAIGECGSCTVLLDGQPVCSCLVLAGQVGDLPLVTVEGLAAGDGGLHPVQADMVANQAMQCGYCIPGIVVSATALRANEPVPTPDQVREALSGNLCRCTGYDRIVEALTGGAATDDTRTGGARTGQGIP